MTFDFPIDNCNGIPINNHPGAFGYERKYDIHTGIDLYTVKNEIVFPVLPGEVVSVFQFTGKDIGMPWWLDTWAVMIKTEIGTFLYGEIEPAELIKPGYFVEENCRIGNVIPVLPEGKERPDIPGHSRHMLHLELYKNGSTTWESWTKRESKPFNLLDPTPYLLKSNFKSLQILTWDGAINV